MHKHEVKICSTDSGHLQWSQFGGCSLLSGLTFDESVLIYKVEYLYLNMFVTGKLGFIAVYPHT